VCGFAHQQTEYFGSINVCNNKGELENKPWKVPQLLDDLLKLGDQLAPKMYCVRTSAKKVRNKNENDLSLAFVIIFNDFIYYTGGDLEGKGEIDAANDIPKVPCYSPPSRTAFKAGHHGSQTSASNEFLCLLNRHAWLGTHEA